MDQKPYESSPEIFYEAVDAIIDAELSVASGRREAPYYVVLIQKLGHAITTGIDYGNDENAILLWAVKNPRPISEIKAMISLQGEPFGEINDFGRPDSWIEWYLKFHFNGIIKWNFNKDLIREIKEKGIFFSKGTA